VRGLEWVEAEVRPPLFAGHQEDPLRAERPAVRLPDEQVRSVPRAGHGLERVRPLNLGPQRRAAHKARGLKAAPLVVEHDLPADRQAVILRPRQRRQARAAHGLDLNRKGVNPRAPAAIRAATTRSLTMYAGPVAPDHEPTMSPQWSPLTSTATHVPRHLMRRGPCGAGRGRRFARRIERSRARGGSSGPPGAHGLNSKNLGIFRRQTPHNGSAFNGRPGAEPHWNHEDRSARPVRCSAWLACIMLTSLSLSAA
jgi:hypothetical protein